MRRSKSIPLAISFLLISFSILFAGETVLLIRTYGEAYTAGMNRGQNDGRMSGNSDACSRLADQLRWTTNVSRDMVASRHYTQATADQVIADSQAAYNYACLNPVTPGNVYDPRAIPTAQPLSSPSLPLGHKNVSLIGRKYWRVNDTVISDNQ